MSEINRKSEAYVKERNERNRERIIKRFHDFLDDNKYFDDLPKERIGLDYPNYHFMRARGNFFTGIKADLDILIEYGIITDSRVLQVSKEFMQFVEDKGERFTTEDDLKYVKHVMKVVLEYLEK